MCTLVFTNYQMSTIEETMQKGAGLEKDSSYPRVEIDGKNIYEPAQMWTSRVMLVSLHITDSAPLFQFLIFCSDILASEENID